MKTFIAILAVMCASVSFTYAESVSSGVFGTYQIDCPANSDTYISVPVTRAPEFVGVVESVLNDALKIVAKGEPNWTANQFVYAKGTQSNHYYVKFTSGDLEGAWFNVVSNDAYKLELEIGAAELAKVKATDAFELIPHWTLSTLFPDGGGFTKSTAIAPRKDSTILWKYTLFKNGTMKYPVGKNNAYSALYYYRERGTNIGWKDGGNEDSNDDVIEPNCFMKVSQPELVAASITVNGTLPMSANSIVAFTSVNDKGEFPDQDIYLAVPSGADIKLSELTPALIDSGLFVPSTGIASAPVDSLFIYDNAVASKNPVPTYLCFYRKRGTTNSWLDGNRENADNLVLKSGTALIIRKKSTGTANAVRSTFKPFYVGN